MSISQKIKAVMDIEKQKELANYMGVDKRTIIDRFKKDNWKASDLIKIAEFTGCELAFVLPEGGQVFFSIEDVKMQSSKHHPSQIL